MVDVSQVVLNGDSTERTFLLTLSTSDTANCTSLHSSRTLVLIYTRYKHTSVLRSLLTEFDDVSWTSLDTSTARGTLLIVDFRNTCCWINTDSTKLTCSYAIATSQTAKTTCCLTGTTSMHRCTCAQSGIFSNLGSMLTCSVTSYYSHHGLSISNSHSQQVGHLSHSLSSTYRTHQSVKATSISTFYKCISHTATTRETTSSTIGSRK